MRWKGWLGFIFISGFMIVIWMFAISVLMTVSGYANAQDQESLIYERQTLPKKCMSFYNNGTDQWVECMGVGYK